jgi:arylsulfatase A
MQLNAFAFPQSPRSILAALAGLCVLTSSVLAEDRPPNIVIVYIDDMGYADIGPFGATGYKTPHLDRMAQEGTKFTSFYSAQAVCSASRAALLTGCYPNRIGISGALGPAAKHGLSDQETTLAEICKERDYATAIFGKWHLGHRQPFLPTRHGFDEYFGLPYSNDMWPHHPEVGKSFPALPLFDNETIVDADVTAEDQKQLTRQYTERAVQFIERNHDRPFFLYLPHTMVHVPLFVSDSVAGKSGAGTFGDVVQEIDWSIGQITETLEKHQLDKNTLVIFTSDNGPWLSYGDHAGSAGDLREGKGTSWEGGVRVPCLMRWPGKIAAGRTCDEPLMTVDLLPTVAQLIGAKLPERKIDGLDASDVLLDKPNAKSPHDALLFYYNQNDLEALRSENWKLILPHAYRTAKGMPRARDGIPSKYGQAKVEAVELYDLATDRSETKNVAAEHPEVVAQLLKFADSARADMGDGLTKSPGANRREPGRVE